MEPLEPLVPASAIELGIFGLILFIFLWCFSDAILFVFRVGLARWREHQEFKRWANDVSRFTTMQTTYEELT